MEPQGNKECFAVCLTIRQVFTADWLYCPWSQKGKQSARAGHHTGSHQSQSERWLVQRRSSWQSHKKAANVCLQTCITPTHITRLTRRGKRALTGTLMTSPHLTQNVLFLLLSGKSCLFSDEQLCVRSTPLLPSGLSSFLHSVLYRWGSLRGSVAPGWMSCFLITRLPVQHPTPWL